MCSCSDTCNYVDTCMCPCGDMCHVDTCVLVFARVGLVTLVFIYILPHSY